MKNLVIIKFYESNGYSLSNEKKCIAFVKFTI